MNPTVRLSDVKSGSPESVAFIFSMSASFWKESWFRMTEDLSVT